MASKDELLKSCPFPEVAEALQPYIKTRQEAEQIRSGLQATLPVSFVDLTAPTPEDEINAPGVTGVRKAYQKALLAHREAQAKHDALKAELAQLAPKGGPPVENSTTFLTESYLPLLRQREKHRQLKVVESAYAKICAAGPDIVSESFDKVTRREIGEPPVPPAASLTDRDAGSNSEYEFLRLKKAILAAKQEVEEKESAAAEMAGGTDDVVDAHADLKALQLTHNELTTWMENQLALISDVGGSNERSEVDSPRAGVDSNAIDPTSDIEQLYEQYLDARRKLLAAVANPPTPKPHPRAGSPEVIRRGSGNMETEQRLVPSEFLLPFMPALIAAKEQEQSLVQQSAYTRRQLASAEARTQATLLRLADESHLVEPDLSRGPPRGKDWNEAAGTANENTITTVKQRLERGQASVESAARTLEAIKTLPQSLDPLLNEM